MYQNFPDEQILSEHLFLKNAAIWCFFKNIYIDIRHCEVLLLFFKDQKRVEKVSKRVNAIQEVKESVSLLSQLLEGYSKESCSPSNQELIKVSTAQHI